MNQEEEGWIVICFILWYLFYFSLVFCSDFDEVINDFDEDYD